MPSNATQIFLGDESGWSAASIELHDVQGLWGGHIIRVTGARRVTVQIIPTTRIERRAEFELDVADWQQLMQVLIENDFVTIQPLERPGLPDEGWPRLTLINAVGEQHVVSKWAGVVDQRFGVVYSALLRLKNLSEA